MHFSKWPAQNGYDKPGGLERISIRYPEVSCVTFNSLIPQDNGSIDLRIASVTT